MMTQYPAATQQFSTSSSSPNSTNNSPGAFSHVATTPPTAPLAGSPGPTYQRLQDGLPIPLFPPSLDGPERNGPQLPQCLPQLPINATPKEVAEQDLETPDNWVNRNPELVRLTGKHPFNSEARLGVLFECGFLTPAHLHFVRNHGAVPQVNHEMATNWTIRVHGLVERTVTFTLQELQEKFPVVTLPVTLVCAGNRRKEQNVVHKTLGFSWGAAGVSTALWTGVYLADVLDHVRPIRRQAKYVIFEGEDNLPNGPYGTSQRLSWASNKDKGMLISWAMNGLPLEPDHGFPVRVIVPGQIGGRSVKWLRRIEISDRESQHHLHFWDNKMLPTQVMPDQARAEKHWWYDPRYIITELNVNSVIAKPDHNEKLYIDKTPDENDTIASYPIRGYAYAGGGRRVTRVEVSLDQGETWTLGNIEYPEDRFREVRLQDQFYGTLDATERDTSFCWCFWSFDVSHDILASCDALVVRAMDEGLALQQRDMYWHALGMMNNWWFRVVVHRIVNDDGKIVLQFEHPTLAGTAHGGWMERMKVAGEDITKPVFGEKGRDLVPRAPKHESDEICLTKPGINREITLEEFKAQDRQRPWFVVNGEVYDGTPFLKDHPGGGDSILLVAGEDASEDFFAIHSAEGKRKLAEYHIGTLITSLTKERPITTQSDETFLERSRWKDVKLCAIKQVNHDSYLYRFALPKEDQPLGLPVGQHVFVRLRRQDTGEMVQRAYTPVSQQGTAGFIDLLIKLYLPSKSIPTGGKMTTGFHQLRIGDSVELKGPLGSFIWDGPSTALWKGIRKTIKEVGMICGGSGITPILQVLRSILQNADSKTRVWVISANKTEHDILCKKELDRLFVLHGRERFKLHYTLSVAPEEWPYSVGWINDVLLSEHIPRHSEHGLILACGPDAMITHVVKPGLQNMGWDIEKSLVVF
ncbi:hypothetical protein DFJ58DRAFT_776165 [Suillus subalutaceus]|uniref:uncharacterized protein n=1 Tax=Suillus subalutaceus TaxID=48586 RepID=UPI001B87B578|nr:uncharacterized protein DFJ58DRAFT_776165 [Suillus subalutaceus]KAG1862047.1 hypothetical protein DFJ58DRAFT_776165 [Suillus subalutaceus]